MNKNKNMTDTRSLVKGSAGTLGLKCMNLSLGFVSYLLLAKIISIAEFGLYSLVISLGLLIAILVRLGMDKLVIRYTAEYREVNENNYRKGLLIWTFLVTLLLSSATSIVIIFLIEKVGVLDKNYYYSIPVFFGVGFTVLCQGFFRASHQHFLALAPDQIGRQGLSILIILCLLLFGFEFDSSRALAIHALSAIVIATVTIFALSRYTEDKVKKAGANFQTKRWVSAGVPVLWSNLMVMGELQAVVLIAGWLLPLPDVGTISLVMRLSAIASLTLVAVNLYIAPTLSSLYIKNQTKRLQVAMKRSARLSSFTLLPIAFLTIYFGKNILQLFGSDYVDGYLALVIFVLARGVSSLFGSVGSLLTQTGHEREVAVVFTISVTLMILLAVGLSPVMGSAGIAVGVLVSTVFRSVANWAIAYRKLGISSFVY